MWVWLKLKLRRRLYYNKLLDTFLCGYCHGFFCKCLCAQTPLVRPKSAIYTPKRDDEQPRHFYTGVTTLYSDHIAIKDIEDQARRSPLS